MLDEKDQIGCGYCAYENICMDRNPKINKAKLGCDKFIHYSKLEDYLLKEDDNYGN